MRLAVAAAFALLAPAAVQAAPGRAATEKHAVTDKAEHKPARPAKAAQADEDEDPASKPVPFDHHWLEPYFASGPLATAAERFRREDWRAASDLLAAATRKMSASAPERKPALYLLALAHLNLEEWSAADLIFEELYDKYPVLAPYHAHYAARCRLRRGDAAGAILWAQKVPAGAPLEAESALLELEALGALGQYDAVETQASRYLDRFPNGPRRAEALFRKAEALEQLNRPVADAAAIYHRIWAEAPLEAWSRRARERLEALASKATAMPAPGPKTTPAPSAEDIRRFTPNEWLTRATILFDRNQNEEAEAAFGSALDAAGTTAAPDLRCKAEFNRAQSLFKMRQRTRAVPGFVRAQAACRDAGNRDLYTKAIYQGARCQASAGDRDGALAAYAQLEKDSPDHSYADDARLRAAELMTDAGDTAKAAELLADIPARYPKGDQLGEALWRLALSAIQDRRWDEAHKWLDQNLERIPHEDLWYAEGRALYWKARIYGRQGDRKSARTFYTRAIREYPLSVYAFLSLERMRTEFPEARKTLMQELRAGFSVDSKPAWQFAPRAVFGAPEFRRAVELARLGLGGDARRELARLGFTAPETRDAARAGQGNEDGREDVLWITSVLLDRGRSWAASAAIPRYTLTAYRASYPSGHGAALWRLSFPRAFPELVVPNSRINKVPEALQLGIMREESAFNPRIESVANALGLTQMLVKTARRFTDRPLNHDTLLDPARNLEVGSRFLAFLLDRYSGRAPLAISGYNAGEGAVDKWLGERGDQELDEFLETIPFDETRNYTKRVLSSYFTYAWLYDPKRPVPELSFTLKPPRQERVGRPPARDQKTRRPRNAGPS